MVLNDSVREPLDGNTFTGSSPTSEGGGALKATETFVFNNAAEFKTSTSAKGALSHRASPGNDRDSSYSEEAAQLPISTMVLTLAAELGVSNPAEGSSSHRANPGYDNNFTSGIEAALLPISTMVLTTVQPRRYLTPSSDFTPTRSRVSDSTLSTRLRHS